MTLVKQLVIALILDLTLFFNLERLSFGEEYYHFINIQGFVYAIGVLAVISLLLFPPLRKRSVAVSAVLWLGIYACGKLVLFKSPTHPALGGFNTFVTIAEVALIILTIWIAHALSRSLQDFEQAVENITVAGISHRLRRIEDAGEDIQTELIRSRRHKTPVSIVVIEPSKESIHAALNRAVEQVQTAMMARYVITSMAAVLSRILRRTDMVLEQGEKGRFIIFSPETTAEESQILVNHIRSTILGQLQVNVDCAVAEFPRDALTFEELVHEAERRLSHLNAGSPDVIVPAPTYNKVETTDRV